MLEVVVGTILGFTLGQIVEYLKKQTVIKGYNKILQTELRYLKEDRIGGLDDIIEKYYSDFIGGGKPVPSEADLDRSNRFLQKWSFWHKYAFLRNNLDKLSLFKPDTVKSILKIYSQMEEFEQFRTGDPKLALIQNLELVQKEIPNTLLLLENENRIFFKRVNF